MYFRSPRRNHGIDHLRSVPCSTRYLLRGGHCAKRDLWRCRLGLHALRHRAHLLAKVSYCALGNSGLAGQLFRRESFRLRPDLIQILRIDHSLVFAASFVRRVKGSRFRHHGQIDSARPARRCLFADEMELSGGDVPAYQEADCFTGAHSAIGAQSLLSALDRMRLISSSIVLRDSQPVGFGSFEEFLS
jgi:hypothetical protein